MEQNRREFIASTAWMGAAAIAAGCMGSGRHLCAANGAPMQGFAVPPLKTVRVGFIGVGGRGSAAVERIAQIPGCTVAAICDINDERLDRSQKWLRDHGFAAAREWGRGGKKDAWKGLCDSALCDVVYSATPRPLHAAVNVYGLDHGKHVMQEVPGVYTIDECWATVEAAERNRLHCYMLENCVYGEAEMLAFNLVKKGKLGEIVQVEAGYTHDQRGMQYNPGDGVFWRLKRHLEQHGNYYPTHGLVPAGRYLDINRGDRFTQLVAFETKSASFEAYAREKFAVDDWRHDAKMVRGDVNMSMMHTANGKTLVLKHNVCSPNPYDRGNFVLGTKGVFAGTYFVDKPEDAYYRGGTCRFGWIESPDEKVERYFPFEKANRLRLEYRHPFWNVAGEISRKVGGHGGMDFLMDLRWVYCLQNGLPMDTDVYDLATYSSVVELSERSVNENRILDFPDYTRGGWKSATPFTVDTIDMGKFDFKTGVAKSESALSV